MSDLSVSLMYPTGPNVNVDNVINCNEGEIKIGGYLHGVPEGIECYVVAKVYSGRPYTVKTMPAAPPQNLIDDGRAFVGASGMGAMMGTYWQMDVEGVLCAFFGLYPDIQLLVWACLPADTPEAHVYSRQLLNLQGVATRPTQPGGMPGM